MIILADVLLVLVLLLYLVSSHLWFYRRGVKAGLKEAWKEWAAIEEQVEEEREKIRKEGR